MKPKMKVFILFVSLLSSQVLMAENFLDEFDGKTVSCEITKYSKDAIVPFLRDQFSANKIYITFDSQDPNGRRGFNLPSEERLYVIEFRLVDKDLGSFQQFFTMDLDNVELSKKGRKNIMKYEDDLKSYRLEFSENILRDKYKFIKNDEVQFSCKSLFDWK